MFFVDIANKQASRIGRLVINCKQKILLFYIREFQAVSVAFIHRLQP